MKCATDDDTGVKVERLSGITSDLVYRCFEKTMGTLVSALQCGMLVVQREKRQV